MSTNENGSKNGADTDGQEPNQEADLAAEGGPQPLEQQLEEAQDNLARAKEKMLRTAADFDNFRKRTAREVEEIRRRGRQAAVRELLPVFDSLERATAHADQNTDAKSMAEGIDLVLKQFINVLGKMNIERVNAVGEVCDPSVHDAIQMEASDEHEAGVIMAEVQAGYRMGEELIRPAMVVVSRGPAQPEAAESTSSNEAESANSDPDEANAQEND